MELIGPDELTDEGRELQALLNQHPELKKHLTFLLNGYRELVQIAMEGGDPSDIHRSNAKKENAMRRRRL